MDLALSPEHSKFRDDVRAFIAEALPPHLRVKAEIGSATDDVGTSKIASTFSLSYQLRAIETPTSGLFW